MDKERTREGRRGAEGQDQEERESRVRRGGAAAMSVLTTAGRQWPGPLGTRQLGERGKLTRAPMFP